MVHQAAELLKIEINGTVAHVANAFSLLDVLCKK